MGDHDQMRNRQQFLFLLMGTGLTALLIRYATRLLPFISDDALISLRYTQRLLEGHGLSWTEGPAVEGYSNLLWVLFAAVPGLFGVDLILGLRVLGIALLAMVPLIVLWSQGRDTGIGLVFTALLFTLWPLSVTVATWAIGGLEQPLQAALLAGAIAALLHKPESLAAGEGGPSPDGSLSNGGRSARKADTGLRIAGLLLGLSALTRPDGYLFAMSSVVAALIIGRKDRIRREEMRWLLLVPLLFVLGQLLFRVFYYGDWLPNTARVKLPEDGGRIPLGIEYLFRAFSVQLLYWLPVATAFVLLLLHRATIRLALALFALFLPWSLYLVVIGGDGFPSYRQTMPLQVVGLFLLAAAVREYQPLLQKKWRLILTGLLVLLLPGYLLAYLSRQRDDYFMKLAVYERWEWDGRTVAETLRAVFEEEQPLIGVTAAGCIPYFSGFPAIDMFGLNDRHIARQPRKKLIGGNFIGHDHLDPAYLLDRAPDLIIFTDGTGRTPEFGYETAFGLGSRFQKEYVPVLVLGTEAMRYEPLVWFRFRSGKTGCRPENGGYWIPAYFFERRGRREARLGEDNRFFTLVPAHDSVSFVLPDSLQECTVDADAVDLHADDLRATDAAGAEVRRDGDRLVLHAGATPLRFCGVTVTCLVSHAGP